MHKHNLTIMGLAAILAGVIPLLAFEGLRSLPADPILRTPLQHFYIVSTAALLAALIAIAIGIAGRRQRNIEVSFLASAFISLSLLFLVHGLATPGFLLPPSKVTSVTAELSVFVTAIWFALSATSSNSSLVQYLARRQGLLVPLWALSLGAVGATGLLYPHLWSTLPVTSPPLQWILAGCTIGMFVIASMRYWQSYTYSRFPLQLAIVYAGGWLAVAQWIMVRGTQWRLSWWLYHYLLVAATGALIIGIVWQYAQGTSLVAAVRGLFLTDPMERLEAGLSASVHALIIATEARDPYTAGHSYHATLTAVRLAAAMGLPAEKLRALAQGGVVHDVGKIEIPDQILNKPGVLTADERTVVEKHPITGYEMCRRLGFMPDELEVIRLHHEWWNGTGYPDGLAGERIPLLVRIMAIADVYDALTSHRAYRSAWSHEQARAYVVRTAGTQFDPRCVEVWEKLTAKGPVVRKPQIFVPQRAFARPAATRAASD